VEWKDNYLVRSCLDDPPCKQTGQSNNKKKEIGKTREIPRSIRGGGNLKKREREIQLKNRMIRVSMMRKCKG